MKGLILLFIIGGIINFSSFSCYGQIEQPLSKDRVSWKAPERLRYGNVRSTEYIKNLVIANDQYDSIEAYQKMFGFEESTYFSNLDSILYIIRIEYPIVIFHKKNVKTYINLNCEQEKEIGSGVFVGVIRNDSLFLKTLNRFYKYEDEFYNLKIDPLTQRLKETKLKRRSVKYYSKLNGNELSQLEFRCLFTKVYYRNEGVTKEPHPLKELNLVHKGLIDECFWDKVDSLRIARDNINVIFQYLVNSDGSVSDVSFDIYDATTRKSLELASFKYYKVSLKEQVRQAVLFSPAEKNGSKVKSVFLVNVNPHFEYQIIAYA